MPQGKEMDISYFVAGELMPGSTMEVCVWCGCPLSSLRAFFIKNKEIKKRTIN